MKLLKSILLLFVLTFTAIACSGGGNDDGAPPPINVDSPTASTLIFPENNTECNEGVILSDTESTVLFRWDASDNTDSYQVSLRDLNSGSTRTLTSITNELEITILRGNPYAWSVISRSNASTQTAQSEEWKFYNAGVPIENFVPFPADLVSPEMGSSIDLPSGNQVTLEWNGSDIDDDIQSYEVLFGTENPPTNIEGTTSDSNLAVNISSGEVYYWRVITIDSQGNSSSSEVFQFRVN